MKKMDLLQRCFSIVTVATTTLLMMMIFQVTPSFGSHTDRTAYVNCIKKEDCENLEITIKKAGAGAAADQDYFEIIKTTDEDGRFDFIGVPLADLNIFVEIKHFCWQRGMESLSVNQLLNDEKLDQKAIFQQRGYEVKYAAFQQMHGLMIFKNDTETVYTDENPPFEKKVHIYSGQGQLCLEYAGIWEYIPEPKHIKLEQIKYIIDTSVPNFIEMDPTFFSLEGQLRFQSEQTLEEELDDIGIRVNGIDYWELEDIDEVPFEPLFRQYRVWIPYKVISESKDLEIQATSSKSEAPVLFKPQSRLHTIEVK